jgi:acid phosphatase (class A)
MKTSWAMGATAVVLGTMLWAADAGAASPGYIPKAAVPDMLKVLPAPPAAGTGVAADDQAAFASTRKFEGTPRWDLAINDADQTPEAAFLDFSCALGVTLDDGTAPTLQTLLSRVKSDEGAFVDPPKNSIGRPRPYLSQPGNICVEKTDALAKSPSYPSGHATLSWAWGLILSELAPDRAVEIMARARVIGESRVVCGVHYPSDIETGRLDGSAMFAALQSIPDFRADMEKARAEVAAARSSQTGVKPDPAICKREADAEAQRPW